MTGIRIKKKNITIATLVYIYLPVMIFLLGFTRLFVALICITAIGYCMARFLKKLDDTQVICVSPIIMLIAATFFIYVGYLAGWGRFTMQAADWLKHDSVISDLVQRRWPVVYNNGDEHSMLTYYIAQYMVPALCGKITGSTRTAEITLFIWNEVGLSLVYLNLLAFLKARDKDEQGGPADRLIKSRELFKNIFILVFIPLFSIPLWLSELILKLCTGIDNMGQTAWFYRSGDIAIQYSNNFSLLRWVFPQAIAGWLLVLLLIQYKEHVEEYLLLLLPGVLYATLAFVGIIPLAIGCAVEEFLKHKQLKSWIISIFSISNIMMLLTEGIVFILYFAGNVFSDKPSYIGYRFVDYSENWKVYLIFVGINICIYALILFRDNKRNAIYYMSVLTLVILPLFSIGRYNDLCMRSSIPSLFVLMVLAMQSLKKQFSTTFGNKETKVGIRDRLIGASLVILLGIGAVYPVKDMIDVARTPYDETNGKGLSIDVLTLESYANRFDESVEDDLKYNYYTYDCDNDFFYKYIARR